MFDEDYRGSREKDVDRYKSDEMAVRNLLDIFNTPELRLQFSVDEIGKVKKVLKDYALITAGLMERRFAEPINNKTANELIQGPTAEELNQKSAARDLLEEQYREHEKEIENNNNSNKQPWYKFGK